MKSISILLLVAVVFATLAAIFVTAEKKTEKIHQSSIKTPKKLRAPLTTYSTPFTLFHAYNDKPASISQQAEAEYNHGVRYITIPTNATAAASFSHETTSQQHGAESNPRNPFWSGRALEDPVLKINFNRQAVDPSHPQHKATEPILQHLNVVLNDKAWGIPCFRARVTKVHKNTVDPFAANDHEAEETLAVSAIHCNDVPHKGASVSLPLPSTSEMEDHWKAEGAAFWRVVVEFEHRDITSFVFETPTGLGQDVLDSGEKYDITPQNATMGFKFMVQLKMHHQVPVDEKTQAMDTEHIETENTVELWAFRKPPMPDFRLSLFVDQQNLFSEDITSIGYTSHAFGVKHEVEENQTNSLVGRPVAMYAEFVEPRRELVASYKVDVDSTLDAVLQDVLDSDKTAVAHKNYNELVLEAPIAGDAGEEEEDLKGKNVQIVFRHYASHSKFTGLYLKFPFGVKNAMVSFYTRDKKTGERVHLFLREADGEIPFPSSEDQLYGWDDAIPMMDDSTQKKKKGGDNTPVQFHEALRVPFEIEIQFDRIIADHLHNQVSVLVERWIMESGGHCNKVDLAFLNDPHHSHARFHDVLPAHHSTFSKFNANSHSSEQAIVSIPMYNIFTASLAMNSGWGQVIKKEKCTASFEDFVKQEKMHEDAIQFMYLTLATLSHVYDGSHSFRVLFKVFENSAINLPPLFHTHELNLFAFSDGFIFERQRMINMWEEEYNVLSRCGNKLRREITKEMYFFHRSQVEARAINGSGNEMQLIPVIDLIPHSDKPNAEVIYDHDDGHVSLVAREEIDDPKTPISINFGTGKELSHKTQLGFILQHGIAPEKALKSITFVLREKQQQDGSSSTPPPPRERPITIIHGIFESVDPLVHFFHDGHRFPAEEEEEGEKKAQERPPETAEQLVDAKKKVFELLEEKLRKMPTEIKAVSDEVLVQEEKERIDRLNKQYASHHKHHPHHHHHAHKERKVDHLRASFDAASTNARSLLFSERATITWFMHKLQQQTSHSASVGGSTAEGSESQSLDQE